MRYAIYTPNFGPYTSPADLAEMAHEAEAAGWDGFFLWDHVAGWSHAIFDPWVTLTAVALATTRLRFGCITPIPRRRPWKLARETASLDQLSNGRLTLIVGTGIGTAEWDDLGEESDPRKRGAMLDEGLEVLTGLWSGKPFSYEGKHYHVKETCFSPTPVQSPRAPIWVGGFWPHKAPFRRMARWDGMFPLFEEWELEKVLPLLREALAYVREQRADPTTPFDVAITGVTPGDAPAIATEIVSTYAAEGATWWLEGIAPYRVGLNYEDEWPLEAFHERIRQGPPKS